MIKNTIHALVFPIEITRVEIFRDGGTVGITLKDAVGDEVEFCLDGSIRRNTRDRFYWGAFYPGDNSGQLVERGLAAEESIIVLLKQIIGQWYSEAEQKVLTGVYGKKGIVRGGAENRAVFRCDRAGQTSIRIDKLKEGIRKI